MSTVVVLGDIVNLQYRGDVLLFVDVRLIFRFVVIVPNSG
jgi:hypothetical protein